MSRSASLALPARSWPLPAAGSIGALGVVYGDIGTSPLYALREAVKAASAHGAPLADSVLGVVSLIIWSLILIISLKYAILILRADNRGEGGIVALLAILKARHARPRTWRGAILAVGLVGAALLYGDGAITPAISVLSAVEGLKVDAPALAPVVVPADAAHPDRACSSSNAEEPASSAGSSARSCCAGSSPSASSGVRGIMLAPGILAAFSPVYAADFLLHAPSVVAFAVLGATFLAVTGGEAIYADMGHFGRVPDPACLVRNRSARAVSQLFRAGRAAAGRSAGAGESVLSARARLVSLHRWSRSPPLRPSSPRRRSFPERSRSPSRPSSSVFCRGCMCCTRQRSNGGKSTCRS